MPNIAALTGNQAIAEAMRQIEPDGCPAFPITPSTQVMELYAEYAAKGLVDTELIRVESEHSAISACVGAASSGARVMTATSSQGLALMHEILYIASSARLPIVMAVANRALSGPINIHGDHSDTMGSRDAGWIQLYAENAQEAYHTMIQAVCIAEHQDVKLPVMVCYDGFTISHSMERVALLDDAAVRQFVGIYAPNHSVLDIDHPISYGVFVLPDYYTEMKMRQRRALDSAVSISKEIDLKFSRSFGASYGLCEAYGLDDADVAVVAIGSTAGTPKQAVDRSRENGIKAGLLRLRLFRPFPAVEVIALLRSCKAIAVLDRADAPGTASGPLFADVRSALYDIKDRPLTTGFVYGLGGRELLVPQACQLYRDLEEGMRKGVLSKPAYLSVRQGGAR